MTTGGDSGGYTIIEVMIFLAVSAILFVAAMSAISGRQKAVEFAQSTRDTQSKMQQFINNVAAGYYPSSSNFKCTVPNPHTATSRPSFATGSDTQGSSNDCVFLGKVLQFAVADAGNTGTNYQAISVTGRRLNSATPQQEVTTLQEAMPTAIVDASSNVSAVEPGTLQFGLHVTKVIDGGASSNTYGAIAFFSTLPGFAGDSTNLAAGAQRVSFGGVPSTSINQDLNTTISAINAITDTTTPGPGIIPIVMNPPDGIIVCLADTTGRKAMITVGGSSAQTQATLEAGTLYNSAKCG